MLVCVIYSIFTLLIPAQRTYNLLKSSDSSPS